VYRECKYTGSAVQGLNVDVCLCVMHRNIFDVAMVALVRGRLCKTDGAAGACARVQDLKVYAMPHADPPLYISGKHHEAYRQANPCCACQMPFQGYTIFADGSNSSAIRAIRALRALRPLRTIVKVESLRLVVEALLAVSEPRLICWPVACAFHTSRSWSLIPLLCHIAGSAQHVKHSDPAVSGALWWV
jgi:hypothetical protein